MPQRDEMGQNAFHGLHGVARNEGNEMTARKYAVQVINTDGTERDPVEFKSARAAHDCLMGELERSGSDVDSVRVMQSDDGCPGQWVVIDRCDPRNAR